MGIVETIIKKRNGLALSQDEINYVISSFTKGEIPDYQMSALLMAIVLNGANSDEQFFLTKAMLNSGDVIDLSGIDGICVDKHSTGGVGDKTTLVIAPIVASCGLKMAKMSGRGLGHTGGTLDKLESIPGYKINVSKEDFFKQVNEIGLAVVGQTANIVPADKLLYALRDVTGTVDSIALIASSIMSKKLASGAHTIILDVKVGDGAFMKTIEEARKLAFSMVNIGKAFDRKLIAVLSDMDEPLGMMAGNSLEVIEAIETLKGQGSPRFLELCIDLSAELLLETKVVHSLNEAKVLISKKIKDGSALEKFRQMIKAQGGDEAVVDNYHLFSQAKEKLALRAREDAYIARIEALKIGQATMLIGAGRAKKDDLIDPSVGVELVKKVGDKVHVGEIYAYIYTNGKNTVEALKLVEDAYYFSKVEVKEKNIIIDIIK